MNSPKKRKVTSQEVKYKLMEIVKEILLKKGSKQFKRALTYLWAYNNDFQFGRMRLFRKGCEEVNEFCSADECFPKNSSKMKKLLEKLFPKVKKVKENVIKFRKNEYMKKLNTLFRKVKISNLKRIYESCCGYSEKKLKYLNDYIEWMVRSLFELDDDVKKRRVEKQHMMELNDEDDFFQFFEGELVLPREIVMIIFSYLKRNSDFINCIGLVNEQWYLFVLKCWGKIVVNQHNIYSIPLLVLKYAKELVFQIESKIISKEIEFILKHINSNIKSICLEKKYEKFFACLKRKKFKDLVFKRCESLHFFVNHVYLPYKKSSWKKKLTFLNLPSEKKFPNLKELILPSSFDKFKYSSSDSIPELFLKIKKLRITSYYTVNTSFRLIDFMPDGTNTTLPSFFKDLKNLKEFNLDVGMRKPDVYKNIGKMKNITVLSITFGLLEDLNVFVNNYKKIVNQLNLSEFKIIFHNVDGSFYKDRFGSYENKVNFFNKIQLNNTKKLILEFQIHEVYHSNKKEIELGSNNCVGFSSFLASSKIKETVINYFIFSSKERRWNHYSFSHEVMKKCVEEFAKKEGLVHPFFKVNFIRYNDHL